MPTNVNPEFLINHLQKPTNIKTSTPKNTIMLSPEFIKEVIVSFVTLFIILDPFLGVAIFLSMTKGESHKERLDQSMTAVAVAGSLLIFFLLFGIILLELLGISMGGFRAAGGVILLILGIQTVLGIEFKKREKAKHKAVAVIIGTPILSGPGAITTVILLSQSFGFWPPFIAIIACLLITWVMLSYSEKLTRFVGDKVIEVLSRVLGLILAAMAVEFITNGILEMVRVFK